MAQPETYFYFLSCLYGSEHNRINTDGRCPFLSCLYGSEPLSFYTNYQIVKENMAFGAKNPFLLGRPTAIKNQ
ncbi:hypothetical protein PSR30_18100 [Pectobacterium carotovorum subsp. carotovorum]|nr:hypothetical protein [Pectobacterium carotovorum]WDF98267.1 hypothetical protein PSR30_18100 [Pectobacterium carotovorum subsp. carotovorum]